MSLTTFKRDGTAVAAPVWCVPVDNGTFGFWTSSASGKLKRLAHTDRVVVQPCDNRGRIKDGTTPEDGTARLATGAELEDIRARVVAKYGFFTKVTKFLNWIVGVVKRKRMPYGDRGIVVTLGTPADS